LTKLYTKERSNGWKRMKKHNRVIQVDREESPTLVEEVMNQHGGAQQVRLSASATSAKGDGLRLGLREVDQESGD
jgi:hypothetical protein